MANWAQFGHFHLGNSVELSRKILTKLTFVASGLDINGCVLSYFEGTANLQSVHSLLYIVAKCHFFSVVT